MAATAPPMAAVSPVTWPRHAARSAWHRAAPRTHPLPAQGLGDPHLHRAPLRLCTGAAPRVVHSWWGPKESLSTGLQHSSHRQRVCATTTNQQQHLLERSKGNIPEFLYSLLIRGCLTGKTFIIPALPKHCVELSFFFSKKSSQQLQPSFSCTESSCSPAAQLIPALLADLSTSQAKTAAVHRSCGAVLCHNAPSPLL